MYVQEQQKKLNIIGRGALTHAACFVAVCFAAPLVMGSNIWPIAGVFWSVLLGPLGGATGALTGWAMKKQPRETAVRALWITGAIGAVLLGVVIASNR